MVALNSNPDEGAMTPEKMVHIIKKVGANVQIDGNVVNFELKEIPITLVYDTNADRMRLIAPICRQEDLSVSQMEMAMKANFHSALDARYCISNDIVWAAFIHPLSDLSPDLFESGIIQVATARVTFGGDYTSGHLVFQG